MKNAKKLLMFLTMAMFIAGGVFAGGKKEKIDDLDAAIRDTSNYLNSSIPAGSKIVILNVQSDSSALSDYIIDELIANAVNDKIFSVVDRQQLDAIRAEQNFQFSGEVADNQALEIGKFFGAQTIVSGAVGPLGTGYRMRVRALEVQTALVQGQFNRNITESSLVATIIGSSGTNAAQTGGRQTNTSTTATVSNRPTTVNLTIVNNTGKTINEAVYFPSFATRESDLIWINLSGNIRNGESRRVTLQRVDLTKKYSVGVGDIENKTYRVDDIMFTPTSTVNFTAFDDVALKQSQGSSSQQSQGTPSQSTSAPGNYRVGQAGPAGGIIFYDKGNNSGGWRFLEAAPVEAEFQAVWSVRSTFVENTQEGIGFGRRNTQLIIAKFAQTPGEWDTAAQKCDDLEFGGFDDWFLPSKAELDLMYGNLKRRNLGDFKNATYWCSFNRDARMADSQNFTNGTMWAGYGHGTYTEKDSAKNYVRPIRQVAGQ